MAWSALLWRYIEFGELLAPFKCSEGRTGADYEFMDLKMTRTVSNSLCSTTKITEKADLCILAFKEPNITLNRISQRNNVITWFQIPKSHFCNTCLFEIKTGLSEKPELQTCYTTVNCDKSESQVAFLYCLFGIFCVLLCCTYTGIWLTDVLMMFNRRQRTITPSHSRLDHKY